MRNDAGAFGHFNERKKPQNLRQNVYGIYNECLVFALTLRLLMSYIYMERPFLMFLDHTQRCSTVGRTPLDE